MKRRLIALHKRVSLQIKILVLVTVVTVGMLSVIVAFDSYSLWSSVQKSYISQLDGMTTAINGRYEESHSLEDVQQIFDYIQFKKPNVLKLTLYGKDKVLVSTDRSLIGTPTPAEILPALEQEESLVDYLYSEADGVPKDVLTAPLLEDGVTIGAIELVIDTSDSMELVKSRIQTIIIVGLSITLLLLIALSLIIRILLIRPLLKIRQAAVTVKQGGAYRDIILTGSHEMTEVASAFNEMVHDLESRYTDLQQALNTVKQAQKKLVESEKMVALGSLVAGVSHEVNTPIGIGVTAASYLQEKAKSFEALYRSNGMKRSDLEEYVKTVSETTGMIQSNLQRASELIKSFKQVAVDTSVQIKRRFKIKDYLQDVLISLKPQLKKTKHTVTVQGSDHLELFGDPGAVSQLVTNLIMNSLIHAYDDSDEGHITIQLTERNKQLTLVYSDDGKGMPPEVLAHIFDPFFTTNRGGGGTGLGMHIVYNIVTQSLGGTIECNSQVGGGTSFTIQIPMIEG